MSKELKEIAQGKNFKAVAVGPWAEVAQYVTGPFRGKVFLKEALGTSGSEMSVGVLPPNTALPFFHAHKQNEELYIFLRGAGEMQIDGQVFGVQEGATVRVSPSGMRSLRSGKDGLTFICLQMKAHSLQEWTMKDRIVPQEPVPWTK